MYKRFSIEELKTVQNKFIPNLYSVIKKERCQWFNDLVKVCFREWDSVYHFYRWEPIFRITQKDDYYRLIDEREKIEIVIPPDEKGKIQSLIKTYITKKERQVGQKSIEQILLEEFKNGTFNTINEKPYIVYDIETTVSADIHNCEFLLAYYFDPENNYTYVAKEDIKDFVKKMVEFDGYIVSFNGIYFDNPVSVWNAKGTDEEIEIINNKTIDMYLFMQAMTGKRMWLNKIAEAFVGVTKTLESWAEWEVLWKKYQDTGEEKYLEEFKKYCKNDVKMTTLVLFYLLYAKKLFIDWVEKIYTIKEFVEKAQPKDTNNWNSGGSWEEQLMKNQSIFE